MERQVFFFSCSFFWCLLFLKHLTHPGGAILNVARDVVTAANFNTDPSTGIMTYHGAYPFDDTILNEMVNGWRTLTPEVLRRRQALLAKLPDADMVQITDRIKQAAKNRRGCDKALVNSTFPESSVPCLHQGLATCVMQVYFTLFFF